MRFRGKSIRRKIVALLLVPLVSLTVVWGFATVLTGREASRLFDVSSAVQNIGYPLDDAVRVLQQERRQTLVHLADPRASDTFSALRRNRAATDQALAVIRRNAADPDVRDDLDQDDNEALTAVLDAFDGVTSLRRSVEEGTVTRAQAFDLYNRLVDPCYTLLATLDVVDDAELDNQYRALVSTSRARELLSREDALLGSALVVGEISRDEMRAVLNLVAQRDAVYGLSLPQLPASERDRYERFWKNATTAPLRTAEQAVAATAPGGMPRGVTAKNWDTAAGNILDELGTLDDQAGERYQDRVRPVVMDVILKAVVAGFLGLAALLFSLLLSVRIGRGLIRDLRQLRLEAHEASGVRLPSVMRRLSAGEQVDVETEVPRLEYDRNEIGEVGQALNTLQRAAVEAAVKQSELRAGVSEVFVNLARRSQVLLHKQLTLLDTMERRTEDTGELADLFRLDHLTTRMRRHAEGLVILSGAAPSRQWRKPIQLMDVVRAAVAEVEDYERIEVRRLPRVAVTGPAVADLTHLVAELLENATVFSPPHTAVQVVGERVANGFTLEIHDRGLGMGAEALLDANLRLAETPEFELSDTDRLGLFVVSRLAQRQNVRVSLQPSPYGGTTAVVFLPDALLTDDVPDTNGIGFRLDRPQAAREAKAGESRRTALSRAPVRLPGLSASLLDGPIELEGPVELSSLDPFPGALDDTEGEGDGLFRPRRSLARPQDDDTAAGDRPDDPVPLSRRRTPKLVSSHGRPVGDHRGRRAEPEEEQPDRSGARRSSSEGPPPLPARRLGPSIRPHRGTDFGGGPPEPGPTAPASPGPSADAPALPRRTRPTAGPSTGPPDDAREPGPNPGGTAPVEPSTAPLAGGSDRSGVPGASDSRDTPGRSTDTATSDHDDTDLPSGRAPRETGAGTGSLPRRVRQASLAPQLKQDPARRTEARAEQPAERDADAVRSRMASLQRGWRRGREENPEGDAHGGTAPEETTKGDAT
ncbi:MULTISPECIES: nitrate- and nitrite sensing domain-containing protein [unclassified Streptomyces]|uniref:nitrate- and nitrite sensing domain-containing protein n=1 Tax=unclassified Streptomyces TaxID=2593676 RepID=UPI001F03475A|nr:MULTISPECIES: nitrate- and nitrite sensing domain-containing protein [unclassified Streptomyces]MCH0564791.1 nitrate- and nitrite sensing domain-containing protein [Streptomyces sp. MUM 2J]MCH0569278.1 nitrate- and nitrite sensing domain-containing protein [Streptomyces sp. MUM 136J]